MTKRCFAFSLFIVASAGVCLLPVSAFALDKKLTTTITMIPDKGHGVAQMIDSEIENLNQFSIAHPHRNQMLILGS